MTRRVTEHLPIDLREGVPLSASIESWLLDHHMDGLSHPSLEPVRLFVEDADVVISD